MKKQILILSVCLLVFIGLSFAAESGPLSPAPFQKAGQPGPVANSKLFILDAPIVSGKAQVILPIDTPKNAIFLVLGEPSVRAFTGDQMALEPMIIRENEMKRMNMPAANTRFNLNLLSAGKQMLYLQGLKGKSTVKMVVSQPDTQLNMNLQVTPLATRSGEVVTVTARFDDVSATQKVAVNAALANQPLFLLNDNGLNGDKQADDGIYSASFNAPQVKGFKGINIRISASGERFDGTPFLRNGISSVMVTNPVSAIIEEKVAVSPAGITVPVQAANGRFRVVAIFGFEGTTLAYSRDDVTLSGTNKNITLPLPKEALAANRVLIKLLNHQTLGLEDEVEINLTPTQAAPDFEAMKNKQPSLPASKARAIELMKKKD
jgi:hypothetical protein